MNDENFFDDRVQERLLAVVGLVKVDVDEEWARLVERLAREEGEAGEVPEPPASQRLRRTKWLMAIAAVAVIVLTPHGRQAVERVTVSFVHFVLEVVGIEADDPAAVAPPEPRITVVAPKVETWAPTTTEAPTTTHAPTTTTSPPPEQQSDPGHRELQNQGDYARGIRQVHIQLNDAIGYRRSDFEALEGAPALVERLIGQRPEFDERLRDTLGHLRQALRARDRNAASAAHTIIYEIEQELGTAGKQ